VKGTLGKLVAQEGWHNRQENQLTLVHSRHKPGCRGQQRG